MDRKGSLFWIYLLILPLIGAYTVMWLTPRAVGISPDSTIYLAGAQSLLAGTGYALDGAPITHFPPLFPLLLAVVGFFQHDLVQAARELNASLFGFNLAIIALLVYLAAGRRLWVSMLAAAFVLTAEPLVELHAWAWSEPLFIALILTSLLLLVAYGRGPRLVYLIRSAILLGLAVTTRYIGLGLLPAGAIFVYLARPRREIKVGLRDASAWLGIACLPVLLVFVRNELATGSVTDRIFAVHPPDFMEFALGITGTVSRLIALDQNVARLGVALVLLLVIYLILPIRSWRARLREVDRRSPAFSIPFAALLFCGTYLPFLYFSLTFLDASTPLDARILAPLRVLIVVGGFPGMATLADRFSKPFAWWGFVAAVGLSIVLRLPSGIETAERIRREGLGYTSRQWIESETVNYARTLPAGTTVYSNEPEALRFLDGLHALRLPAMTSALSMEANRHYRDQLAAMCEALSAGGTYLVYFDMVQRANLPTLDALRSACKPPLIQRLRDGSVYGWG